MVKIIFYVISVSEYQFGMWCTYVFLSDSCVGLQCHLEQHKTFVTVGMRTRKCNTAKMDRCGFWWILKSDNSLVWFIYITCNGNKRVK